MGSEAQQYSWGLEGLGMGGIKIKLHNMTNMKLMCLQVSKMIDRTKLIFPQVEIKTRETSQNK